MIGSTLSAFAERSVFSVDGAVHTWADVVEAARLRGEWAAVEQEACQGLAAVGNADGAAVAEAARRFRRDRDLLAADELEDWLLRWGLTRAAWLEYLRRSLVRRQGADVRGLALDERELEEAVVVEAICSGSLERAARRLAEDSALAASVGEYGRDLAQLLVVAERKRAAAASAEAVERELVARRLEWTRFDCELVELADENVAREAAACVRVDGQSLAEIAAACGTVVTTLQMLLADVDAELAPHLLGAIDGELIGPLRIRGGFALVLVRGRVLPDLAAPELRARAESAVVRRAAERELRERVQWYEPIG